MAFEGFPKGTLTFLRKIEKNNNRKWFEANRDDYESKVLDPSREFVKALGHRLDRFDPEIEAEPKVNGSIRRLNRDTRFSKDKSPYKNHLDFLFPHQGFKRRPGYWVRITPRTFGVGAGLYGFDSELIKDWREAIGDDGRGRPLADVLRSLERNGYRVYGEHYKKVPRGFDEDHPRADLLRHNSLHVGIEMKHPPELHSEKLISLVFAHVRKLSPVTNWLVDLVDYEPPED